MAADSKIEWTHHTFNPWWGCVKVSPACAHCYAERDSKRYGLKVWGQDAPRRFFGDAHWREPEKWDRQAARAGERHRVFCASMADVFEARDDLNPHRQRLFDLITRTPHLDWLLLTKRPERIRASLMAALRPPGKTQYPNPQEDATDAMRLDWLEGRPPHNVWLLTSLESADYGWRVAELLSVPAVVHGLSCEPLLGPVDLTRIVCSHDEANTFNALDPFDADPIRRKTRTPSITWVIAGGESGPKARPSHPDWFRALRDQCHAAAVPFLFKQWGEWRPGIPVTHFVCERGCWDQNNADRIAKHRDGDCCDGSTIGINRVGKKAAGRLLDGREWSEFPRPREAAR